jgi:hypothetical protein
MAAFAQPRVPFAMTYWSFAFFIFTVLKNCVIWGA